MNDEHHSSRSRTMSARIAIIILLVSFLLIAVGYGYVLSAINLFHP